MSYGGTNNGNSSVFACVHWQNLRLHVSQSGGGGSRVSLPLLFVVCARAYVLNPLSGTSAPAVATQVAGEHTTTLASACRIPLWLLLGGGRHASMRRRGPGRRKPRTRSSIGGWARAPSFVLALLSPSPFPFPSPPHPRSHDMMMAAGARAPGLGGGAVPRVYRALGRVQHEVRAHWRRPRLARKTHITHAHFHTQQTPVCVCADALKPVRG